MMMVGAAEKKDTTNSWRYPIPGQWTKHRLGEVLSIIRGISFPKEAKSYMPTPGLVACLRTANIQRTVEWDDLWFVPEEHIKRKEQLIHIGDILISTANSYELVGKVAPVNILPHRATLGAFISLLRPNALIDSMFAYYQLAWSDTQDRIRSTASTTTNISNVSTKKLENLELALPPLHMQKRIVAEIEKQFSRLDEAVTNLKRVKANLKRYRASVLKAAVEGRLVETEAEVARREGREYESGKQLLERILETRRREWKGKGQYKEPAAPDVSELPELPEGWAWGTVEQMGAVQLGRQRSPKNRSKDYPVQYLRAANITEAGLDLTDLLDMEFTPQEQERYRLQKGDIVLSEASGSPDQVGKPAIWQDQLPLCCFQNTVIRLRPTISMSTFLFVCFHTYYLNGIFAKTAGGVGINHLSAEKFSRMTIPLPPLAEQQRIVAEVDRRLSLVRETEAQVEANLKRAERLRQSVLQKAFSGELVRDEAG